MISKKDARRYAYDLVAEGKVCYQQLQTCEKEILTGLLIEATPHLHAYEYISDADPKTELPYMLGKYMETNNQDLGKDILKMMIENACKQMSGSIDTLLKEQQEQYDFDQKFDGA